MTAMGCANQKACKLLYELENKCQLIERKRQGLGKPNLIYVKNFVSAPESKFKNGENQNSGVLKIETQEFPKSKGSNTEKNNTDFNDTESLPFSSFILICLCRRSSIMRRLPRHARKPGSFRFIRPTPRYFCARMPMNSGRHESSNRKNSTALQGVAEREPFDQSGVWGEFPQQAQGDFRHPEISLFVKFV